MAVQFTWRAVKNIYDMGEVEIQNGNRQLIVHSTLFFYGGAATDALSVIIAEDIANHWNAARGRISIKGATYAVKFTIEGIWAKALGPDMVFENTNPRNNYFRIEEFAESNISFVDGVGSNTGYFKLDNLLNNSTTAAHEYGHTIGLHHPYELDIRGQGIPGIMYPRGTIVDAAHQYSPIAKPLGPGGTMNPFNRQVLQNDIDNLHLPDLVYNRYGFAVLGNFTNVWHQQHLA